MTYLFKKSLETHADRDQQVEEEAQEGKKGKKDGPNDILQCKVHNTNATFLFKCTYATQSLSLVHLFIYYKCKRFR